MFKGKTVRALGAMSGTSLDGVDAAVVVTDGQIIEEFGPTAYQAYTDQERAVLKAALGLWPDPGRPNQMQARIPAYRR